MTNALIIINAADIPAAVKVAADLDQYIVVTCDPVMVDKISAAGFSNIQFIDWKDAPLNADHDPAARAAAVELEAELDRALAGIVDVKVSGWQHLSLFYVYMSMRWYEGLWDAMAPTLAGHKVHVFICDKPADFYFNSFLPSIALIVRLKNESISFSGYTYGAGENLDDMVLGLAGLNEASAVEQMLIHLPTCMYNASYFWDEARSTGRRLIGLEAKYFDIPLPTPVRHTLVDSGPAYAAMDDTTRAAIDGFTSIVTDTVDRALETLMPLPAYRKRQAEHLGRLYRAQLITYLELNRHFSSALPASVLMSDHDAGFHGPIIAFAQKHHLRVTLVPHASTVNDLEFSYANITACSHPIQHREVFDAAGRNVLNLKVAYPEEFKCSSATSSMRTISLLLNAISMNGIYFSPPLAYMQGLKRIVDWCRKNGIAVKVRCKPSYSLAMILSSELGISREELMQHVSIPMDEHIDGCDLGLMFDAPTSAAMHYLRRGVPLLNPVVDEFAPAEIAMGHAGLLPPENITDILRRLERFKSDPSSFMTYRTRQFARYVHLFEDARPLRTYLT